MPPLLCGVKCFLLFWFVFLSCGTVLALQLLITGSFPAGGSGLRPPSQINTVACVVQRPSSCGGFRRFFRLPVRQSEGHKRGDSEEDSECQEPPTRLDASLCQNAAGDDGNDGAEVAAAEHLAVESCARSLSRPKPTDNFQGLMNAHQRLYRTAHMLHKRTPVLVRGQALLGTVTNDP